MNNAKIITAIVAAIAIFATTLALASHYTTKSDERDIAVQYGATNVQIVWSEASTIRGGTNNYVRYTIGDKKCFNVLNINTDGIKAIGHEVCEG